MPTMFVSRVELGRKLHRLGSRVGGLLESHRHLEARVVELEDRVRRLEGRVVRDAITKPSAEERMGLWDRSAGS